MFASLDCPIASTCVALSSILLATAPSALPGQAAASTTYFLPASQSSSGGSTASAKQKMTASIGSGVVARRMLSPKYVLLGGFAASFDAKVTGRPWLVGVRPLFAPMNGGAALTLHGTELHLGMGAGVRIGGQNAAVLSRTRDQVRTTLPPQPVPGWQPVAVTAGGSTSTLPRGIGVLPMLDLERPARPGIPLDVVYRGTQGDLVIWFLGAGTGPPIKLPGWGHAFELNLLTFFILTATAVTDPGGEARLPLPGVPWARPLHFQGLVLTSTAGYRPGSFTNVLAL